MRREKGNRKQEGRAFARPSCFYQPERRPSNKAAPSAPPSVKGGRPCAGTPALPAAGRGNRLYSAAGFPPRREALPSPAFRGRAGDHQTGATSRCEELAVIEK